MSDAAPVVWLEDGEARDDAVRALGEWAHTRGVRLEGLEERAPAKQPLDPTLADRAEKELDRARLAIGATDADAAERALARAESLLREHPELPQAAWLRAEVERTWSARWLRVEPRDEARARTAWENAAALDGGRTPGIGESSFPPRTTVKTTIVVAGAGSAPVSLWLDGAPLQPAESDARRAIYPIDVAPAEHHLLATSDGEVVFASWVAIAGAEPTATHITVATGGACSRGALGAVKRRDGRIDAPGVACSRWLAAVPGERRGSVLVARCEKDTCGPLLEWRTERLPAYAPAPSHGAHAPWPSWATWAIVGVGAATATSIALVATGVFEARAVEPRFVVGGARQE
ncbi:MAG: hypothetical protein KF795_23785 [Labilithrix sp.]|nr:hypothetical protein [Labilithrix sp.]